MFTYQGRLNDGGGPASGNYDLRLRLFVDPLGNNQAGSAVLTNAVPVTNGLFTVAADFGAGIFTGSNYWLEVDVKTNGGAAYTDLNPLQAVTPTPYAIFAENVGSGGLAGAYGSAVTFNNAADQFSGSFTGNGAGVTNVNASVLNGLSTSNFWQNIGNAGTTAGLNFVGTTDNQPLELRVNGQRVLRLEPGSLTNGSPNIIGGSLLNSVAVGVGGATISGGGSTNYYGNPAANSVSGNNGTVSGGVRNTAVGEGTVGGGAGNAASGGDATVGGGLVNTASGSVATVGGGWVNTASGSQATVAGGFENSSGADYTTVGGGFFNQATYARATVSGGYANIASGDSAVVGGGTHNHASTNGAVVTGGFTNVASGMSASVGGGYVNTASGTNATVPGGSGNAAAGLNSFAAGNQAQANNDGAFVWADAQNAPFASTDINQFLVRASGGVGINTNAPAGAALNVAGAVRAVSFQGDGSGLFNVGAGALGNYVFAYNNAVQSVVSGNAFQDVTFAADAQLNGWAHMVGTSQYTNAQTGLYLIQFSANATTTGVGTNVQMRATLNGTEMPGSRSVATFSYPNQFVPLSKSLITSANAGDVVTVQFTGAGTGVRLSGTASSSLTITRIQ